MCILLSFHPESLVYPGRLIHKAQIFHLVHVQAVLRGPWWRWAPFWLRLGLGLGFVPSRDVGNEMKTSVCVPCEAHCHIEKQHVENKIWHGSWLRWMLRGQLEPLGPPVVGITSFKVGDHSIEFFWIWWAWKIEHDELNNIYIYTRTPQNRTTHRHVYVYIYTHIYIYMRL